MKTAQSIVTTILCISLLSTASFGEGILRVPGEQGDEFIMHLADVDVQVDIIDQVAITTVHNTFINPFDSLQNCMYHYRLPISASVTGFGIYEEGELVEYELRPGEQGGPGGGIGDNNDLRELLGDNPFSAPMDSVMPGEFTVYLRYALLLPYDFGISQYRYPLFNGRFMNGAIDNLLLTMNINAQREMTDIAGVAYEQQTEMEIIDQNNARIVLTAEDFQPHLDWGVDITYEQEDIGAWLYTHRSDLERPGYFMLVIEPGIVDTGEAVTKYFTFVLDRSGSMSGDKIIQARQAVINCLDHLLPIDFFNIIDFASDVQMYSEEMLQANNDNLQQAQAYIGRINASGCTNIYGALMTAIDQEMGEDAANQVIFTTDGLPTAGVTDPDVIIGHITDHNQDVARIYSFGIGHDVNIRLLTGLSELNDGIAIFFDPNEESIEEVISEFYAYLARPALVNPVVEISEDIEADSLYPRELQDVSAGKQLMLFGLYDSFGMADIALSGTVSDGDTTMLFEDMEFPEENEANGFVPRMWAKSVIDYWVKWMLIFGERDDIIEMIIALSMEYGVLSPYTEYNNPDNPEDPGDEDGDEPPPEDVNHPEIATFDAVETELGVELAWSVTGSASSMSFNVYKSSNPGGPFRKINDAPLRIPRFIDTEARGIAAYYRIEIVTNDGTWFSKVLSSAAVPEDLVLDGPYPNPFNNRARVSFSTRSDQRVSLVLYDLQGREVVTVFQDAVRAGTHYMTIDATDIPSGMYMLRLYTSESEVTRKVEIIK